MKNFSLLKTGWRWLAVLIILAGLSFNLTSGASADDRAEIALENTPFQVVDPAPAVLRDFGRHVAISGNTMAVSPFSSTVLIYEKDQGGSDQWGLATQLNANVASNAMDLDGDILFAGNKIFYRNEGGPGNWGLVHTFSFAEYFANKAILSGNTLAVSADFGVNDTGNEVRIFYKDQDGADQWGEVTTLWTADPDDCFGCSDSLALEGDFLLVGAMLAEVGGVRCGKAYLYARDEDGVDNWGQVTVLHSPRRFQYNYFGWGVAIEGQTAAVSAIGTGIYIYSQNKGGANNWGLVESFPVSNLPFVSMRLFNGVLFARTIINSAGVNYIHIFQNVSGFWQQQNEILPSPDTLPAEKISIFDVSSEGLAVGMPSAEPDGISDQGAVYIFRGAATDLDLAKTVSADEVTPGGSLTYTLTVTNAGPGQAEDMVVTDYLPNGVTLESVTGTGWTCDSSGQEIICTLPSLAASAAADPITIDVTVGASTGWINNIAILESLNLELDLRNNQQVELTQVAWPALTGGVFIPLVLR
jgi:uncharacterized repeat protein (TIGR01451 family)